MKPLSIHSLNEEINTLSNTETGMSGALNFTGQPTAPTANVNTVSTQVATTKFVADKLKTVPLGDLDTLKTTNKDTLTDALVELIELTK